MGPCALFDKSFLQCLNVEEAGIFSFLFRANITPIFYAETLADLEGGRRGGETPEEIVAKLARKTPVWDSTPNADHRMLCIGDLLGEAAEMRNVPIVSGGIPVRAGNKRGIVFEKSPEMRAFERWQRGDFIGLERDYAKAWRENLRAVPREVDRIVGSDGSRLKLRDFTEVSAFTDQLLDKDGVQGMILNAALAILHIPLKVRDRVRSRWQSCGRPKLADFAPYAFFVFRAEVFFHICLATGKIASQRPSNRLDLIYIYYLPFSDVFVSGDKLHRELFPYFKRERQAFIWAPELKSALAEVDALLSSEIDVEEIGLIKALRYPPLKMNNVITQVYDEIIPGWREQAEKPPVPMTPEAERKIIDQQKDITNAARRRKYDRPMSVDEADSVVMTRSVPMMFGKHPVFHKGFKPSDR